MTELPRGIRNNNPGNLRYSRWVKWRGLAGKDADGFCIFETPVNGIRAMAKVLLFYFFVLRLNTLAKIITRWAPPSENVTGNYIERIETRTQEPRDKVLYIPAHLFDLVREMIAYENGQYAYDGLTYFQGIDSI